MIYKAKVAVCSDIRTKHSMEREHHVEFLNVKPWWYVKNPLGFKGLIIIIIIIISRVVPNEISDEVKVYYGR